MSERDRHRWIRFAGSASALLLIAVVVPAGLVAVSRSRFGSANPLAGADPPWDWGSGAARDALSDPIADDTVIDAIIRLSLCVVWSAIAILLVTTAVEVVHHVRHHGLSTPPVRGVGWAQRIARPLAVGLVAVLPATAPTVSLASAFAAGPATAAPVSPTAPPSGLAPSRSTEAPGTVHVVAPGESIYAIAVDLAGGDPTRVLGIADAIIDANLGAVMPGGQRFTNPAYIEVGWTLQIPSGVAGSTDATEVDPADDAAAAYTVEPGDTLWEIAEDQLGDPTAWPVIWERNAGHDMGGGRTFDDPDLILPGWELDLAEPDPPAAGQPVDPAPATPEAPPPAPAPSPDPTAASVPVASSPAPPLPAAPPPTTAPVTRSSPATAPASAAAPTTAGGEQTSDEPTSPTPTPPIRLEHAALVAAGVLTLVGVRRRQRLRAAMPRHRVPEPSADVTHTERMLRRVDAGERMLRTDVACRAVARSLIDTGSQIGWITVSPAGDLGIRLTAPAVLPAPWTGEGQSWQLGGEVPVELLGEAARGIGQPCVALAQLGVTSDGDDLLVDLEACGVLAVTAAPVQADAVVTALATAAAASLFAEVAHLVGVSLPEAALLDHRNAHIVGSVDAALELACSLAGGTALQERTSFELRSLRTGGEAWEPAIVLLRSTDDDLDPLRRVPGAGRGVAIVVADEHERVDAPSRLLAGTDGWCLQAFGGSIDVTPVGASDADVRSLHELVAAADLAPAPDDPAGSIRWADDLDTADRERAGEVASGSPDVLPDADFEPRPHEIVVGLLGGVEVRARTGELGSFERSKTVELIAWLTTHRDRSTRTGARTALWELDVRDATFANVVSEARRALARLVPPPEDEEWVARTLTEQLPLHDLVVTDADLVEDRLTHARSEPPAQAIETLRPAVELVRDLPFSGTNYLWPDAEGITSNLVLLAITATTEFAAHALSLGDTDGVFWATGKGLRVLPGHEELIALRMRAHARAGDLAGVRQEWESYERVLVADVWSDGEPAPKLVALRHELLTPSAS